MFDYNEKEIEGRYKTIDNHSNGTSDSQKDLIVLKEVKNGRKTRTAAGRRSLSKLSFKKDLRLKNSRKVSPDVQKTNEQILIISE